MIHARGHFVRGFLFVCLKKYLTRIKLCAILCSIQFCINFLELIIVNSFNAYIADSRSEDRAARARVERDERA